MGAKRYLTITSADYAPHGAVADMKLGNGLFAYRDFNSRLQMTATGLGTYSGGNDLFGLTNSYGSTANNGDVESRTITAPSFGRTQTFGYDGRSGSAIGVWRSAEIGTEIGVRAQAILNWYLVDRRNDSVSPLGISGHISPELDFSRPLRLDRSRG